MAVRPPTARPLQRKGNVTDWRADTFSSDDFFGGAPPALDTAGQSLLNDMENQSLADFFSNTDPFHLADSHAFASSLDAKDTVYDYNNWGDFIAPATVHRVTTTIPDQAHLQHSFHHEPTFAPELHPHHLGNTHDDLQAASTLFNNAQPLYANGAPHHFNDPPSLGRDLAACRPSSSQQRTRPMAITPHSLVNEQLATVLPNHAADAQFAAHWARANPQQQHEAEFGTILHKPYFKRSYTFGTDSSFNNPAGFAGLQGTDNDDLTSRQLKHDLAYSESLVRTIVGVSEPVSGPKGPNPEPCKLQNDHSEDGNSEDASSEDEDSDRPAKKRRKSKYRVGKDSVQKPARSNKTRKTSVTEENNKKKRAAAAAQKLQRENLTEEQKRSNHILSEQKRRNLIKQGFDDLHDLVPAIRNGGLSKSSVLTEAGNFLDKLIHDNNHFWRLVGGSADAPSQ